MIEANYGVFHDGNQCLLFQRQFREPFRRSWYPGCWDLAGGDIPDDIQPLEVFIEDAKVKFGLDLNKNSVETGGVIVLTDHDDVLKRYIFLYQLDRNIKIVLDPRKYAAYNWYDLNSMKRLDLVPGVMEVLMFANVLKNNGTLI